MQSLQQKLEYFSGRQARLLKEGLHGLEKECLRVSSKSALARTSHPDFLGSPLFHPYFSTDFGEAQLELITPAYSSLEEAFEHLDNLHVHLHHNLEKEYLWPTSAPCHLPNFSQIELAKFGYTEEAYEKWLYRKGLSLRHGKAMQLLSGIHYSFSFTKSFWRAYHKVMGSKRELGDFITDCYLHFIRNFLRMGWLISYLFGASPIVDKTYLEKPTPLLKGYCEDSYYGPYATSIRMSNLGYFSKIQSQNAVSFNRLDEYIKGLQYMLDTPSAEFQRIGEYQDQKRVQMNENILQIEAEHYARIRPKPKQRRGERPIKAMERGIEYVETRILDLDPFCPCGLDMEVLRFMHLFFVYCLFEKSPPILKEERCVICHNQNKVALYGRRKGLKLFDGVEKKEVSLKNWSNQILDDMKPIAALFDSIDKGDEYGEVLKLQEDKVGYPYLTPSGKIVETLIKKKESFADFAYRRAKLYKQAYKKKKMPKSLQSTFKKLKEESLMALEHAEKSEDHRLAGYEDMQFSTQMLIKEAMRQKIQFKVLDRKENLIELRKGSHVEHIKQASQTRLDPLISYFLMENKEVTKRLLKEAKIKVPVGRLFSSIKDAKEHYLEIEHRKNVVKPNLANMGQGISFVEPSSPKQFESALKAAAKYKGQILVEEFFNADEYRLLVINGRVVASCKRMPAHVMGDGKKTIVQLITLKNKQNEFRSAYQKPLKITAKERKQLKEQGFLPTSTPKSGQVVFLMQNSNVSTGGESIDVTDEMPLFYKRVAIKAAKALGATIAGVDILIKSLKKEPGDNTYRVIEVNFNPALYLHRAPAKGKVRYVEKDILKALGF